MYLGDVYTVAINLAGIPGISLPCGYDKNGLPIGLQLLGQTFEEKKIIRAAYTFEQSFKDEVKKPDFSKILKENTDNSPEVNKSFSGADTAPGIN